MNEKEQKEYLNKTVEDFFEIKKEFLNFKLQTSLSLIMGQLQFFQSISGFVLALVGIGISLDFLKINFFSVSTFLYALLLLIITTSYSREIIDIQLNGLEETEALINENHDKVMQKVQESLNKGSIDPFVEFSKTQITKNDTKKSSPLFTGEIVVFLFLNTISNGFVSLLNQYYIDPLILFSLIICVNYFLSFKNWSFKFINFLSTPVFKKEVEKH